MKTKKIVAIVLILCFIVAPLVAVDDYKPSNVVYKQVAEPFVGTSVRIMGMGGAGLGVKGYHDSFLYNPQTCSLWIQVLLPSVT